MGARVWRRGFLPREENHGLSPDRRQGIGVGGCRNRCWQLFQPARIQKGKTYTRFSFSFFYIVLIVSFVVLNGNLMRTVTKIGGGGGREKLKVCPYCLFTLTVV